MIYFFLFSSSLLEKNYALPSPTSNFLLFLIFFFGSSILSPFKEEARSNGLLIFNTFSLYFILKKSDTSYKIRLQKIIFTAIVLFLLFSLIIEINPLMSYHKDEFFLKSNFTGSLSILGLFMAFSLYKETKTLSLIAAICSMSTFYFTKSFSGLMGMTAVIIYLIHNFKKNEGNQKALILFLILCLTTGMFFFLGQWQISSFQDRLRWWKAALEILIQHPFFGSGPGSFEKISPIYLESGLKSLYAHNFVLQNFSEMGTLAGISMFYFIFKEVKNSSNLFLKIGLIAVFTQCLFDYSLNVPGFFLLFFLILGSASNTIENNFFQPPKIFILIFYPILFCFMIFFGWKLGIKPLVSFDYSLKAEDSYQKMDLDSAEKFLRSALKWDDLPIQNFLSLSQLLQIQYNKNPKKTVLLKEKQRLQKIILNKNPYIFYRNPKTLNE